MIQRKKTPKSKVEGIRRENRKGAIIRDIGTCLLCGSTMDVSDLPSHGVEKHGLEPPPPKLPPEEQQAKANRDLRKTMEWLNE